MDIFVADDCCQRKPTRVGMGPLIGTGGIYVPSDGISSLERDINELCKNTGFPDGEEFKWSPRRTDWMYDNLVEKERETFFLRLLETVYDYDVSAIVVVEDVTCRNATAAPTHEEDVTRLMLERVHMKFTDAASEGIVIVDGPGGDRSGEDRFLASCLETLQSGTRYIKPERIALNVVSSPSHLIRLIQLADVITSCSIAFIAGESTYSPPVFSAILPIVNQDMGRKGGVGIKIHPDYKYANLYHWLLGDKDLIKLGIGVPLPIATRPFYTNPLAARNDDLPL